MRIATVREKKSDEHRVGLTPGMARLLVELGHVVLVEEGAGEGSGVAGTGAARVTIIGAGTVGLNAARIAVGMGATVTVLDIAVDALRRAEVVLDGRAAVLLAHPESVFECITRADVVIGAVLVP